jgi:Ca2+-binding RTX toxin-like protein
MLLRSPHAVGPVLAVAAALILPAAASAELGPVSSVSIDAAGAMTWTGSDQANFMSIRDNGDGTVTLSDNGDGTITALDGHCGPAGISYSLLCQKPTSVRIAMGGARDLWYPSDLTIPISVDAGPGDDSLEGSDLHDELHGGPGDDEIDGNAGDDLLDGGDGTDALDGAGGADTLQGGPGNDTMTADGYNHDPAPDVIDGGAGFDTVVSEWSKSVDDKTPLSITLGGGADDGRPGEGDDLRGVEHIAVNLAGTYVGSEGDDEITVRQILDPVSMSGGGGNDKLKTADGSDTVDGGAGADYLDGGFGDDRITGGPGADIIHGDIAGGDCGPLYCKLPYGNDTIEARDGEIDSIDCGWGEDVVFADAKDVVGPDCETVNRGGAAPGGGGAGGAITVTAAKARLAKALRSGLRVKVRVPGAGAVKAKARRGSRTVASGRATASGAGKATVKLRFTKAARKALRRKSAVKLAVTVTFAPKGGAALKRTTKVTLHR